MRAVAAMAAMLAGLILGTPGVASADEQSYLADVRANGVPDAWSTSDWGVLQMGHVVCDLLRAGRPIDSIQYTGYTGMFRNQIVNGAQHELCPDTL